MVKSTNGKQLSLFFLDRSIILKINPSYFKFCFKEEQHANTSANYDVELLHHKDAHVDFLKSGK